jgi:hypothetical protein
MEGRALRKASASAIAKFVWEDIILRYGCIGRIVTDNGPEFKGAFSELLRNHDIPLVLISPYNSQANGVVELGHFAIREALVKACEGSIHLWPDKLRVALFADNITVRWSTGYSAYFLLHGTDPVLPFDLWELTLVEGFKDNLSQDKLLALRIRQIEHCDEDMHKAMQILRQSRLNFKRQFERWFETRLVHGVGAGCSLQSQRRISLFYRSHRSCLPSSIPSTMSRVRAHVARVYSCMIIRFELFAIIRSNPDQLLTSQELQNIDVRLFLPCVYVWLID